MAWVWIGRAGAEMRTALEMPAEDTSFGSASTTVVATQFKTGGYSFTSTTNTRARGWTFSSKVSIRAGAFIHYSSVASARKGNIFRLTTSIGTITAELNGTTQTIDLVVNGAIEDSVALASSGMPTSGVWYQVGIAYAAHASTGTVTFYVEGLATLTWTGNTGTGCTAAYFLGNGASSGWTATSYMDDIYVDGSASIETDVSPPAKQLDFGLATGAGNYAQWTPSASTNVSNIDDAAAPDDDTTYNSATSSGLKDSYAVANPTYAGGLTLVAVLPVAHLRLTDGAFASTVKLGLRESSTDVVGSDISLATAYATKMDRQTSKPSGGDWDATAANAVEFLIESSGVYS